MSNDDSKRRAYLKARRATIIGVLLPVTGCLVTEYYFVFHSGNSSPFVVLSALIVIPFLIVASVSCIYRLLGIREL
jgi:hypothetical protein